MKKHITKAIVCAIFAVMGTSCSTVVKQTATSQQPSSYLNSATVADLDVANTRITFKYEPSNLVRRGGDQNVINTAIQEALKANGGGDLLVGLQYTTKNQKSFGKSSIVLIVVTGYPATYKNFRNLDDSIWDKAQLNQTQPASRKSLFNF